MRDEPEQRTFQVLINGEEQYSLFPVELAVPGGWRQAEFTGTEAECMAFVDRVWTDMRPLSQRTSDRQHDHEDSRRYLAAEYQ
ncbi:MbtH family protein [Nocardia colli]|uniref:MbtH family protein n=1 Tax=Nocardia colli TaxID=2545717 RepID=UPI0035E08714